MKLLAVYPGSFDPLTFGHADLIARAVKVFDRLIVAVAAGTGRTTLFSAEERLDMVRQLTAGISSAEAVVFDGLLVDYVRSIGAAVIVRGVRAFSDFEYEFQMALMNRNLAPDLETMFMMPKETHSYVSSSVVREIAELGGDTSKFAPDFVCKALRKKFSPIIARTKPKG